MSFCHVAPTGSKPVANGNTKPAEAGCRKFWRADLFTTAEAGGRQEPAHHSGSRWETGSRAHSKQAASSDRGLSGLPPALVGGAGSHSAILLLAGFSRASRRFALV